MDAALPVEDLVLARLYGGWLRRRRGQEVSAPTTAALAASLPEHPAAAVARAVSDLFGRGRIAPEGPGWWLCEPMDGVRELALRASAESFSRWMVAGEASPAFQEFCRRVNGLPFVVFDMLDEVQLGAALRGAALRPGQRALDLGCGIGTLTEHVARVTGAEVHGVDFAAGAIARAKARVGASGTATFAVVPSLDDWSPEAGAFDVVFAFDTLYFADDLPGLVARCATALRPGGRLVAFFSALGTPAEESGPDQTRAAEALRAAGLAYEATEYTDRELAHWRRSAEAVRDLESVFAAEGSAVLWDGRRRETEGVLAACEGGRSRRYLYVARR